MFLKKMENFGREDSQNEQFYYENILKSLISGKIK